MMSKIQKFQTLLSQLHNTSSDILRELADNQSEPLSELHTIVKIKRQALKMTQQEVADLADISLTTYKSLESGGNYTKDTLFSVLNVLAIQLCLKS